MAYTIINIGLARKGKSNLTPKYVIDALHHIGVRIYRHEVKRSHTEDTFCAVIATPIASDVAYDLSEKLGQDCIAQRVGEVGSLFGPRAAEWAPFNPEHFILI